MASTKALAAMRRRSGQSRLSHTAPRVVSDAVFMLMLAPWSVVGAIKLAAAKDIGNSPSRHCDASSPDASRNGFSVAQGGDWACFSDWQAWRCVARKGGLN